MARKSKKTIRKKVQADTKFVRSMSNLHGYAVNELKKRATRAIKEK